jgi:hypothetical protein
MTFEDELAALNEWHFFREFTYSKMTFSPVPSQEAELADSVIWLDDFLAIYQLKERNTKGTTTADAERRWFENKVLGKATRQIRETLNYLNDVANIEIRNHRGHTFSLDFQKIRQLYKLVVYLPDSSGLLPVECQKIKHYRSQTAGFIHVISAQDYLEPV